MREKEKYCVKSQLPTWNLDSPGRRTCFCGQGIFIRLIEGGRPANTMWHMSLDFHPVMHKKEKASWVQAINLYLQTRNSTGPDARSTWCNDYLLLMYCIFKLLQTFPLVFLIQEYFIKETRKLRDEIFKLEFYNIIMKLCTSHLG